MKKIIKETLEEKFKEIGRSHNYKVRIKSAKVVLGSSVIRALKKGIKKDLQNELSRLTMQDLIKWSKNKKTFKNRFLKKTAIIEEIIGDFKMVKGKRARVNKSAHAPKILALYCRDLLGNSWEEKNMNYGVYKKIEKLLFCPVDRKVIDELRKFKEGKEILGKVKSMQEMGNRDFMKIQDCLMKAAKKVPRVWFDDVWI